VRVWTCDKIIHYAIDCIVWCSRSAWSFGKFTAYEYAIWTTLNKTSAVTRDRILAIVFKALDYALFSVCNSLWQNARLTNAIAGSEAV